MLFGQVKEPTTGIPGQKVFAGQVAEQGNLSYNILTNPLAVFKPLEYEDGGVPMDELHVVYCVATLFTPLIS